MNKKIKIQITVKNQRNVKGKNKLKCKIFS